MTTEQPFATEPRPPQEGATDGATAEEAAALLADAAFSTDLYNRFDAARKARKDIEAEMLSDLRRREGEYEPDVKARLQAQGGGSMVFDNVTDTKCAGIEAMLAEILFFSGSKPWGLKPSPIPELDSYVEEEATRQLVEAAMAEGMDPADEALDFSALRDELKDQIKAEIESKAKTAAERMEKLIEDQLAEGGFEAALNDFITDVSTAKAAAFMGPVPKRRRVVSVENGVLVWKDKVVLTVERLNPTDIYPASLSLKPGDGDFFVSRPISDDLAHSLSSLPQVDPDRYQAAIASRGQAPGDTTLQTAEAQISQKNTGIGGDMKPDADHTLINWWHFMSRSEIAGFRREPLAEDVDAQERVAMTGLMLNGVVISALPNIDQTGAPNVFMASFRKRPGSIWGQGGAGLAKGSQEQVNVAARALATNIHFSSRPSYQADQAALVDPNCLRQTYPGQAIYTQTAPGDLREAVRVIQTPNHTGVLLAARDKAAAGLDEKSGVYPQSYGSPAQAGPAETLGGYERLLQGQNKAFKRSLYNISQAMSGLIRSFWLWNMTFSQDATVKGDVQVVTSGAVHLYLSSDDAEQMTTLLNMVEKSPMLQSRTKFEGITHLYREVLRNGRFDPDKIVKTDTELEEDQRAEAAKPAEEAAPPSAAPAARPDTEAGMIRANADMIRARAMEAKVELEKERRIEERAKTVQMIRKMQQDLANSRAAAIPIPAAPAGSGAGLLEPAPAMGGQA